jgi:Putative zinc-finger
VTEAVSCVPVSWLRLERYALDELAPGERTEIAGHLAICPACRARADLIAGDGGRELPPLPAAPPSRSTTRHPGWLAFAAVGTMVAAVLLVVRARSGDEPQRGGRRIAVKGGEVTIELVRERAGSIAWEPTSFTADDRFKLLLTCAPPLRVYADLVVLQSDGPAFPGAASLIGCGNRIPLPTSFRITGPGDASVCVAVDPDAPPSRARLAGGETGVPGARVCVHLDPP